jgi:hypothetical protein
MEIRVTIPDGLAAEARSRGVPVEKYVEEIIEQGTSARTAESKRKRTPEEVQAWLDDLAQFSDRIPPLPATITREWIYQDHD